MQGQKDPCPIPLGLGPGKVVDALDPSDGEQAKQLVLLAAAEALGLSAGEPEEHQLDLEMPDAVDQLGAADHLDRHREVREQGRQTVVAKLAA